MSAQPLVQERERDGRGTLRRWAGILSVYFTSQTVTQLLGIATGLLFVNFMPVREYALYTLALSVTTFFNFASDLGSTTSLVHFFHRTRTEETDFQPYLAAVLSLRRGAFLLGALAVAIAFPGMAAAEGFGWNESLLVAGGIVLVVWFQISSSLRVLTLRLADLYGRSYQAEMAGGGLRLLLALGMAASRLLQAWVAVLASALASAAVARLARPEREPRVEGSLRPYRRQVLRYLLPTLPGALYFSIQGPLTVWLAATFGGTRNIAEVGALGRLGLLVGIFSSLTGVVFLPRLARVTDERLYLRRFLQFGGMLLVVAVSLLGVAAVVPDLFLLLLGPRYSGLRRELLLVVAGAGLALLDGYVVNVNLARSWTRWQGLAVATLVAAQAVFVMLLPLSTTAGVLSFTVASSAVALATQAAVAGIGFTRPRWVHWG